MSDAKNVTAGKPKIGGAVHRAALGTALPKSANEELDPGFASLGYVSDDGITNSNSPESDSAKAWGGDTVLNYQSAKPDTFAFKLIEAMNVDVLKTVYGTENVKGDLESGIEVKANSAQQEEYAWVIDMILKGGVLKRIVIPQASITEVGDIVYADEEVVGYETTISAVPDEVGDTHREYVLKPNAVEPAEQGA